MIGSVLVVGAGIAGIQASLDLADSGYQVHLLESSPAIGGTMAQLDKTFPTNDCSMCILSPKVVECARHLNVTLHTWSELDAVEGQAGDFRVRIRHKPRLVDPARCTGCGDCVAACPVERPNVFDRGLNTRKAIYRPYPQAVPNVMTIDKRGTAPCKAACPAGTSAQGYIALIAQGRYAEALEVSRQANPFTAVCGRVCYHPCETACSRGLVDDAPVAIAALKRFMADWAAGHDDELPAPVPVTRPQRVAIVGAGPCGLTAARDLAQLGYGVTVFEAQPLAGGMLRYGIPDYRLPPAALDGDIARIRALGVEIRTGTPVADLDALQAAHGAVLLSVGAHRAAKLRVPGEELPGVYSAIDFLRRVNSGERPSLGRRAVVVGGGNTAIDAARCARRLGAAVTLVYRRSRAEMPAYAFEVAEAEAEGVEIVFLANPTRVLGTERVAGVQVVRMALGEPDADGQAAGPLGRRRPVPVAGSEFVLEADTVIAAIGQTPDAAFLPADVRLTQGGTLACDETMATGRPGVFAGGDAASGPRSAIEAVAMGHRAAESIHRYLSGEQVTLLPRIAAERVVAPDRAELAADRARGAFSAAPRAAMAERDVAERLADFRETALGLGEEQARAEAARCLACGACSECNRCVAACKPDAIRHDAWAETYSEVHVGAVIVATGLEPFDARKKYELGYRRFPDVVTSIEFERLLSASGPTAGHLRRPSDGRSPRRIAFLQCVGSRDEQCGNGHCSSICCMAAIKEAVIAQEHERGVQATVFFMELRAFGKDFDHYYERARDEYGVRFERARVARVERTADGALDVAYETEGGAQRHEAFDLVVLSVGMEPSRGTRQALARLGLRRTAEGFGAVDEFHPLRASREGVYLCGAASGPRDIPETVVTASAAAAEAGTLLAPARHTLSRRKEYPAELDVSGQAPRVGVFVCHCGINIAGTVDVEDVRAYAAGLPHVVYAGRNLFTCSQDTQAALQAVIHEHGINRVVVASCSPRTHEPLFQETLREAGLNPYLFELANIRDQCSWVHQDQPEAATAKARDLVRMAVSRVVAQRPLYGRPLPVTHSALVVGGGVAGLAAALNVARQGYAVHLVEREGELGGHARHLRRTLSGGDVPAALAELLGEVAAEPRITVYTGATVKDVAGFVGSFHSTIAQGGAELAVDHGVVIVASGAGERPTSAYLHGRDPRVLTQRELEEALVAGEAPLPADRRPVVAMIQCVESRTAEQPYCSRVCCAQALKNAIALKERRPEAEIYILYRDVRSYGLQERYYRRARELGVLFVRYDPESNVPQVTVAPDNALELRVVDPVLGEEIELRPDLLALSVGMAPQADAATLAAMLKVPLNADGFFLEAHMKLRPVDFATEGVYVAGLAHGPKNLAESIAQAGAAAARAGTVLAQETLLAPGSIAHVDQAACVACGDCVAVCPYGAVERVQRVIARGQPAKGCAEVNPALCKGCGACAAACRSGCITLEGFDDMQIMAQIAALMADPTPIKMAGEAAQ